MTNQEIKEAMWQAYKSGVAATFDDDKTTMGDLKTDFEGFINEAYPQLNVKGAKIVNIKTKS